MAREEKWVDMMRIYLAGYYNGKASAYSIEQGQYDWFLESYHYINTERHCAMIRADARTIFLDSGAFSAFTKGAEIRVEDYAAFVLKNRDIIHLAANLDDLHKNEAKTYHNQKLLEKMTGGYILPTFHTREDPRWLQRYIDEGYEYIAIGGMVPESKQWLRYWLDDIWDEYLTKPDGSAKVKVHGFGITALDIASRYPWYSIDSTAWVLQGRFGVVFCPLPENPYFKLAVSDQSPRAREWDAHYDTLNPLQQKKFKQLIESRGFTIDELRTTYWKRDLHNIKIFKEMCDEKRSVRFKKIERGLF